MSDSKDPTNILERAKLISDLAAAWQNQKIKDLILSQPSGEAIYAIFEDCIKKEMSSTMGDGQAEEVIISIKKELNSTLESVTAIRETMIGMMKSPLVQVLELMNKNLNGGGAPQQRQPLAPVPQQQPQQQQRQEYQQEPSYVDNSGRTRIPGLGSY